MEKQRILTDKGKEALIALGFTGLEAEIYSFLLSEPPSTGYRIAQSLGKPAANIYKSIESLFQKGMILVEEGENRYCKAVPLNEVLNRIERDHKSRLKEAEAALEDTGDELRDERIYHIDSREQVIQRGKAMLERATEVVMLDIFPLILPEFIEEIKETAARGVEVNLIAYEDVEIDGVQVLVHPRGLGISERWPVQGVNIVIDAKEQLLAYLSIDGMEVHEAIWSRNIYLSWLQHISVISEIVLLGIEKTLDAGGSEDDLRKHYIKYRSPSSLEAPGYRILQQRLKRKV